MKLNYKIIILISCICTASYSATNQTSSQSTTTQNICEYGIECTGCPTNEYTGCCYEEDPTATPGCPGWKPINPTSTQ